MLSLETMQLPIKFQRLKTLDHPVYFHCQVPKTWMTLGEQMKSHVREAKWTIVIYRVEMTPPPKFGDEPFWDGDQVYALGCYFLPEFFCADSLDKIDNVSAFEPIPDVQLSAGNSFLKVVMELFQEKM